MGEAELLSGYVETWRGACADLAALARELTPQEWELSTDLPGWSVIDNVAHTAHLEAVLAGTPHDETVSVVDSAHVRGAVGHYTEQGVLARRGRSMPALVEELEQAVRTRYAALRADPPTDGSLPPRTGFAGTPEDTRAQLSKRPLDVWMHEQDIRRATDRPGHLDSPAALHAVLLLAGALPLVVGRRVGAVPGTTVSLRIVEQSPTGSPSDADAPEVLEAVVTVHADGRARRAEQDDRPAVTVTLDVEGFVVLAGGRRGPDQVASHVSGDEELGRAVLANLVVTP